MFATTKFVGKKILIVKKMENNLRDQNKRSDK